jgi:PHD/YefM family antitoxin component YafN of YafNO toxin-antitoxin module
MESSIKSPEEDMIAQITANDLKVKGITAIDELMPDNNGVIITVRGKEKYVVLSIDEYSQLRELELDAAIQESRKDIEEERSKSGSVDDHMSRVENV